MSSIIALAGSLRGASLNRRLVAASPELAPPAVDLRVFDDVAAIPLFDEDLEALEPDGPGAVRELRSLVAAADGVLIATPEYNQSIPGVMKNLVDWLSRPDGNSALDGTPAAIMGATTGPWGTRYAQKELRHTLTAAGAVVLPQPMLFVPRGEEAFDPGGALIDPLVRRRVTELLMAFDRWLRLVRAEPAAMAANG